MKKRKSLHIVDVFFQVQRYEAASTIYGPHTLDIYLQAFRQQALAVVQVNE